VVKVLWELKVSEVKEEGERDRGEEGVMVEAEVEKAEVEEVVEVEMVVGTQQHCHPCKSKLAYTLRRHFLRAPEEDKPQPGLGKLRCPGQRRT